MGIFLNEFFRKKTRPSCFYFYLLAALVSVGLGAEDISSDPPYFNMKTLVYRGGDRNGTFKSELEEEQLKWIQRKIVGQDSRVLELREKIGAEEDPNNRKGFERKLKILKEQIKLGVRNDFKNGEGKYQFLSLIKLSEIGVKAAQEREVKIYQLEEGKWSFPGSYFSVSDPRIALDEAHQSA